MTKSDYTKMYWWLTVSESITIMVKIMGADRHGIRTVADSLNVVP